MGLQWQQQQHYNGQEEKHIVQSVEKKARELRLLCALDRFKKGTLFSLAARLRQREQGAIWLRLFAHIVRSFMVS